jgi:hypothetical protein
MVMTLVEHVGGQLIEEDKFGKDEGICPHSLKKKSQRCGATFSLVKDQIRWNNWKKEESMRYGLSSVKSGLL